LRNLPERNLAGERLERLLEGKIKSRFAGDVVQAKKFSEWLINVIKRYQNRAIETAPVIDEIDEIIEMARRFPAPATACFRGVGKGPCGDFSLQACAVRQISQERIQGTVDSVAAYPHTIISAFPPVGWRDEADQFFPSRFGRHEMDEATPWAGVLAVHCAALPKVKRGCEAH